MCYSAHKSLKTGEITNLIISYIFLPHRQNMQITIFVTNKILVNVNVQSVFIIILNMKIPFQAFALIS